MRGADTLNICLNAVAVIFALEIDNLLYAHGASSALRKWCEEHARPSLSAADERAIGWAAYASVVGVAASILVGLQLEQLKERKEHAQLAALAVFAIATLPPALAEAAARHGCRDRLVTLASLAVQFGIGYGVSVLGLVDLMYTV